MPWAKEANLLNKNFFGSKSVLGGPDWEMEYFKATLPGTSVIFAQDTFNHSMNFFIYIYDQTIYNIGFYSVFSNWY